MQHADKLGAQMDYMQDRKFDRLGGADNGALDLDPTFEPDYGSLGRKAMLRFCGISACNCRVNKPRIIPN